MQTEEFKNVWLVAHIYMMLPGEFETKDMAGLVLSRFPRRHPRDGAALPVVVGE